MFTQLEASYYETIIYELPKIREALEKLANRENKKENDDLEEKNHYKNRGM